MRNENKKYVIMGPNFNICSLLNFKVFCHGKLSRPQNRQLIINEGLGTH